MALSFRLVYRVCVVANIVLLLVTSTNLRFKYSVSNWRKCDTGNDEFLMLRAIPIQKCIFECLVRGRCKAIKFLTIRRECGLLETAVNMTINYTTRPCVFIQMANVQHNISIPDKYKTCSPKQVCNIWSKTCTFEECERLNVTHAYVLGNMHSVESKAKILPHHGFTLGQYKGPARCNISGEWDKLPVAMPMATAQIITPTVKTVSKSTTSTSTPTISTPTPTPVPPSISCPDIDDVFRTIKLTDGTTTTYSVRYNDEKTFSDAKEQCNQENANLLTVTTRAKFIFVQALYDCPAFGNKDLWIDGQKSSSSSYAFTTWDGEEHVIPSDFFVRKPDASGEECVRLNHKHDYKLGDFKCSKEPGYI